MKKAFTLIELLVVIGIMGLLGTVSVGGYRAMQRGMAERGVLDNVNALVRAAYQRAQIDRQPTAIYFWNETLRAADDDRTEIVVGKAVAIRRQGRITRADGQYLYDEFADLNLSYQTDDSTSGSASAGEGGGDSRKNTMYLYPIDRLSDIEDTTQLKRSIVDQKVYGKELTPLYLSGENGVLTALDANGTKLSDVPSGETQGALKVYAFKVEDAGGVTWQAGMAYGFEFARLELPHGYIFGSSYATDVADPIRPAGTMTFNVGLNQGNGVSGSSGLGTRTAVTVYSLRPDASGNLAARSVGQSSDPTKDLN